MRIYEGSPRQDWAAQLRNIRAAAAAAGARRPPDSRPAAGAAAATAEEHPGPQGRSAGSDQADDAVHRRVARRAVQLLPRAGAERSRTTRRRRRSRAR